MAAATKEPAAGLNLADQAGRKGRLRGGKLDAATMQAAEQATRSSESADESAQTAMLAAALAVLAVPAPCKGAAGRPAKCSQSAGNGTNRSSLDTLFRLVHYTVALTIQAGT